MLAKIYFFCLRILSILTDIFHKRQYAIFESYPDFTGSPQKIYQELERRGFQKKLTFIWAIDKSQQNVFLPYKAIPFWGNLNFWERLKRNLLLEKTTIIIDSNRPVHKVNSKTCRIFTRHGGTLKKCSSYMHSLGKMDYMLSLSDELKAIDFNETQNYCLKDINQVLTLGFPANDSLFSNKNVNIFDFFETARETNVHQEFSKIIGWLPTYRQHRNNTSSANTTTFPFGVPLLKDLNELQALNSFLSKKNILLAIQMHPAEANNFSKFELSNIALISQKKKDISNVSTLDIMKYFDALITDYSAAYHEYILLNRPVALTIDDFDEYASNTGFSFDYFEWIKGVYLKSFSDLIQFVDEIASNIDSKQDERNKAKSRIHKYTDDQSTQRVVDFIIKNCNINI